LYPDSRTSNAVRGDFVCYVCIAVLHTLVAGCWLEVSIRKVLPPATSAQVFLGFPVSLSEC